MLHILYCFVFVFLILIDTQVSVIDGTSPFASAYDLDNIVRSYQDRNCKLTEYYFFVY